MSILDEIETQRQLQRLFLVEPLREFRASRGTIQKLRTIYVSAEINEFLESTRPLAGETQADLNDFILGTHLDVALELDHQFCFMARLDKP
jgi:hypothetical protein